MSRVTVMLEIISFPKRLRLRALMGGLASVHAERSRAPETPRELWRPVLRLAMGVGGLGVVVRPLRADPL